MLPYEHIIIIDKESKSPVYRQIAISIINAIRNGNLKAGTHLPSSRELAKMLKVTTCNSSRESSCFKTAKME